MPLNNRAVLKREAKNRAYRMEMERNEARELAHQMAKGLEYPDTLSGALVAFREKSKDWK